jgi:hypothetical protein
MSNDPTDGGEERTLAASFDAEPGTARFFPILFRRFAFIPHFAECIDDLARLAEPEDWEYRRLKSTFAHPILRSYLTSRYQRVAGEGKIRVVQDETQCCWHTGLVTSAHVPIYAIFNKNEVPNASAYWKFWQFAREGDPELAAMTPLPGRPRIYDDPSALVFDPVRELRVNVARLVGENIQRFPHALREFSDVQLQQKVKDALELALGRVHGDSRVAVPQYFGGMVQLLLPLCLTDPARADLALVLDRYAGFYRANTCLTLDIAYNNARQLARPDREWLEP